MRKKRIAIVGILLVVIISISLMCIVDVPSKLMNIKLNTIINQYGRMTSRCKIISKTDAEVYINASNTNRIKFENVADDKSFIKIDLKSKKGQYGKPNEILSIMDIYLFIKERDVVEKICGIICCYQSGKLSDANSTVVVLSVSELRELFEDCEAYSKDVTAQTMSDKWIKNNYYFRDELEINLEYSNLLSEWNEYITSADGNFELGYIYDDNRLKVLKLEYDKHENVDIVTSRTIWNEKINEEGTVYAAWDKENNIWLLGEVIGVKMFRYDGSNNWHSVDDHSEYKIPIVLEKIQG